VHNQAVHPELAAATSRSSVCEIDNAWSTWPQTLRRARLLELPGWAFYVAGRGGALGDDARPETVAAAMGVIAPDAVRAGWEAAGKVGPGDVAASRLAECARWGEERLSDLPALADLVDLGERLVVAADAVAMPLFAATRAMPMPDGGPGARAAVLVHLMREHRAGALLIAVRACGLSPVEALIAGPEGEEEALAFGWRPPFPARMPLLRRYSYAEAMAHRIAGQAFAALTGPERSDLVRLLQQASDHINR
jgi:hypothetical protein